MFPTNARSVASCKQKIVYSDIPTVDTQTYQQRLLARLY